MPKRFPDNQLRRVLLGGILVMLAASVMQAQTTTHYLGLTYYQILPVTGDEFCKFAETDLLKVGQARVDEEVIDTYYMLRLTTPYNVGSDYNYLQAVWHKGRPSLAPLDMKAWEARAKKAGFSSYQQHIDRRDFVGKGGEKRMASIDGAHRRYEGRQLHADGDLPGGTGYRQEMARFVQEYTMPIAQSRIGDGRLVGWGVTQPAAAIMSDDEAGFSYSISNVPKESDTLLAGPGALTEEAFKKAVPGKSYPTYLNELNRLNDHRKVTRTRIHEIVCLAGTPPTVTP